jgi:hypothetical protein
MPKKNLVQWNVIRSSNVTIITEPNVQKILVHTASKRCNFNKIEGHVFNNFQIFSLMF